MRASAATPASSLAIWPEAKTRLPALTARGSLTGRKSPFLVREIVAIRRDQRVAVDRFRVLVEQLDSLVAGNDPGAVILAHIVQRVFMRVTMRGGHRISNDENLVIQIERVHDRVLDAGFGPCAGNVETADVEFAEDGIKPSRIERTVVFFPDLEVAGRRGAGLPHLLCQRAGATHGGAQHLL